MGQTCYANSALQCLMATPQLMAALNDVEEGMPAGHISGAFHSLVQELNASNPEAIYPCS